MIPKILLDTSKKLKYNIFYNLKNKNPIIKKKNYFMFEIIEIKNIIYFSKITFKCSFIYDNTLNNSDIKDIIFNFFNLLNKESGIKNLTINTYQSYVIGAMLVPIQEICK